MEEECVFDWKYGCKQSKKKEGLVNAKAKRIENIIRCSKLYNDDIHHKLQSQYDSNAELVLRVHKTCVDKYVHPKEVQKAMEHQQECGDAEPADVPPKRTRRSELPNFSFLQNCIFCGDDCAVEKDPKNPSRWRPAYICRQVERIGHIKSLKQEILDKCDERNDEWASQVRIRVAGAVSDLHAADARYHIDCRVNFMSTRSTIAVVKTAQTGAQELDEALQAVIRVLKEDLSRIWNSVDLNHLYLEHGGTALSRRLLITRLSEHFGEDLLVLSSPGIATILAFKSRTAKVLHIIPDVDDDDIENAVNKVKKKICQEVKEICIDRNNYHTRLNHENASEHVSSTVLHLLAQLSPTLDNTLPALLIGNIITSALQNYPTNLQIYLAVVLRDSKGLVKTMNDFGVTCMMNCYGSKSL